MPMKINHKSPEIGPPGLGEPLLNSDLVAVHEAMDALNRRSVNGHRCDLGRLGNVQVTKDYPTKLWEMFKILQISP